MVILVVVVVQVIGILRRVRAGSKKNAVVGIVVVDNKMQQVDSSEGVLKSAVGRYSNR